MPRAHTHLAATGGFRIDAAGIPDTTVHGRHLSCAHELTYASEVIRCAHCDHPLECVEQNRRSGTWLGSFMCPNCRSEYFYAYRWGRLLPKC